MHSSLNLVGNDGSNALSGLLLVDLTSKERNHIEDFNVGIGFVTFELQALKVRHTLWTGGEHGVCSRGSDFFHAHDAE